MPKGWTIQPGWHDLSAHLDSQNLGEDRIGLGLLKYKTLGVRLAEWNTVHGKNGLSFTLVLIGMMTLLSY